jgi:head-tail adaptor
MDESTSTFDNKAGWRTTEFYVTLLTAMLPIITAVFHTDFTGTQVQAWSTVAAAIATVGYSISRSHSKNGALMARAQATAPPTTAVSVQADADVTTSASTKPGAGGSQEATLPLDTVVNILARLEYLTESLKAREIQLDRQ